MPITWKNIAAPDFSAANKLAQAGQEQIQNAMTGFSEMLTARGDRQTAEGENRALQALNSLGSVEEVDQEFATISQLLSESGGDQGALLAAKDAHVGNLLKREQIAYDKSQRPLEERLRQLEIAEDEFGVDTQAEDRRLRLGDEAVKRDIDILTAGQKAYESTDEYRQQVRDDKKAELDSKEKTARIKAWGKGSGKGKGGALSNTYLESVTNNPGEPTSTTRKKTVQLNSQFDTLSQGARDAVFYKHTDTDYTGFKGVNLEAIKAELQILAEKEAFRRMKALGEK